MCECVLTLRALAAPCSPLAAPVRFCSTVGLTVRQPTAGNREASPRSHRAHTRRPWDQQHRIGHPW